MTCSDVMSEFVSCELFPMTGCLDITVLHTPVPNAMQLRLVGGAGKVFSPYNFLLMSPH